MLPTPVGYQCKVNPIGPAFLSPVKACHGPLRPSPLGAPLQQVLGCSQARVTSPLLTLLVALHECWSFCAKSKCYLCFYLSVIKLLLYSYRVFVITETRSLTEFWETFVNGKEKLQKLTRCRDPIQVSIIENRFPRIGLFKDETFEDFLQSFLGLFQNFSNSYSTSSEKTCTGVLVRLRKE